MINYDKLSRDRKIALYSDFKPETDDELFDYVRFTWGIEFPRKAACPGCDAPFKVFSDCFFARYPLVILKGARGSGKYQSVDDLVLCPSGYRRMGDLQVGDEVFDHSGAITTINSIHPQGRQLLYRVTFSDGTSTLAGGPHLWVVREGRGEWRSMTTDQLRFSSSSFEIPTITTLGLSNSIENPYEQGWGFAYLGTELPDDVLMCRDEDRLALLRGIVDCRGFIHKGKVFVSAVRKEFLDSVDFLVQSLGGLTRRSEDETEILTPFCPFDTSLYKERWRKPAASKLRRSIVSISLDSRAECQCITVDSPLHTYITNDCIVTHNSVLLATLALTEQVVLRTEINILGASEEQSRRINRYISEPTPKTEGMFWDCPNAPSMYRNPKMERLAKGQLINGGKITCLTASTKNVRGSHPQRLRIDECLSGDTLVLTPKGEIPIRDLSCGEEVVAFDQIKHNFTTSRISKVWNKGIKPTFYIKLSNGRTLCATSNHLLLTRYGWRSVAEIKENEKLYGMSEASSWSPKECDRHVSQLLKPKENLTSQESSVSYLRKGKSRLGKAISPMLCVLPRIETQDCPPLRGLRNSAEAEINSMQAMSPVVYVEGWRRKVSESSGDRYEGKPLHHRVSLCGITYNFKGGVRDSSLDTTLRDRLSDKAPFEGWVLGSGNPRELLARSTRSRRERSEAKSLSRESRLSGDGVKTEGSTSVVSTAGASSELVSVLSVEEGPLVEVFDISIPIYHNFIAEGVVVHNCDEMDLELYDAALGCPQSDLKNGIYQNTLCASTHQYPNGTLTELISRAREANNAAGKIVMPVYKYCFMDVLKTNGGFMDPAEMEAKRLIIPEYMFRTEYLNGDPSVENAIFDEKDLDYMFDPILGTYDGVVRDGFIEVDALDMDTIYNEFTFYSGADWAKKQDSTVFTVMARNPDPYGPDLMVGWQRMQKTNYPDQIERFKQMKAAFPGPSAHDGNGPGEVIDDYLDDSSEPVNFSNIKLRNKILNDLVMAIQERRIKIPMIKWLYEQFKYATFDQLFGRDHLPDGICSLALAWYARENCDFDVNIFTV